MRRADLDPVDLTGGDFAAAGALLHRIMTLAADLEGAAKASPPEVNYFVSEQPGTTWAEIDGDGGNNTLNGTAGDDVLSGLGGNDILNGGDGDDVLIGGAGVDEFHGGAGVDTISFAEQTGARGLNVQMYAGYVSDTYASGGSSYDREYFDGIENVVGSGNNDSISGNADNNLFEGRGGADTLWGHGGADILVGGAGDDTLIGGAGADTFYFVAGDGNDTIQDFTSGGDTIVISGFYSYSLVQEGAHLRVVLDENNSILLQNTTEASIADGDIQTDEPPPGVQLTGTEAGETLTGGAGGDRIEGLGGNDTLEGLGGADVLIGGTGDDVLDGGAGDDRMYVDSASDQIIEDAGEGFDRVFASTGFALGAGDEVEILSTTWQDGTAAINLWGNEFSQSVVGNDGGNLLFGLGGDDRLVGHDGGDTLIGGEGDDVMDGGDGYDFVDFGSATQGVSVNLTTQSATGEGTDIVRDVEAVIATAYNDRVVGTDGSNTLHGGAGNDVLDGRGGIDNLFGGAGDDMIFVDDAGDNVIEAVGEGFDRVLASASYTLGAGVEVEMLSTSLTSGTAFMTLTGNEFGQIIAGNEGGNTLYGMGGDDVLYGNGGDDALYGGSGADSFNGGAGMDLVSFAGRGLGVRADLLVTAWSDGVEGGFIREVEQLIGTAFNDVLRGTAGDNELTGGDGNDVLDGRGGMDILAGGLGDDTYIATENATLIEAEGEGFDRVLTSSATFFLLTGVEVEMLSTTLQTGTDSISLYGNEFGQIIAGNNGVNRLVGDGGDDILYGNAGDDTLLGGTGDDTLDGGAGTDTVEYLLEAFGVSVNLTTGVATGASIGADSLRDVENVWGSDFGDDLLVGNAASNLLNGWAGNDILDGRAGADEMRGDLGDDTFYVDNAGDLVRDEAGQGYDRVLTSVSYTLDALAEIEVLSTTLQTGGTHLSLTGNGFDQVIAGNNGNNVLRGMGGDDVLYGNGGNDTLYGGTGIDDLHGGAGTDTADFLDATFGIVADLMLGTWTNGVDGGALTEMEYVYATAQNDVLRGTAALNVMYGREGNDVLDGRGGGDWLYGGEGDDWYYVHNSADQVFEVVGQGTDRVFSSVSYTLAANQHVEFLTTSQESGTSAIDLTGNELGQTIGGNNGNNSLNGLGGDDILVGAGGDDTLYGGTGTDTFLYRPGAFGQDVIADFEDGTEVIRIENSAGGADDFADLVIGTEGLNAVVTFPDGSTINLFGMAGLIDENDFQFVTVGP